MTNIIAPYSMSTAQGATWTSGSQGTTADSARRWLNSTYSTQGWTKAKIGTARNVASHGSRFYSFRVGTITATTAVGVAVTGTTLSHGQGTTTLNAGDGGRYQYFSDGRKRAAGTYASYGDTWTAGDVIGIGISASSSNTLLTFWKNGVSQGTAYTITGQGDFDPHVCAYFASSGIVWSLDLEPAVFVPPGYTLWVS